MQNNQIDLSGFEHPVIDGWMRDLNTAAYLLVDTPAGEEERLVVMGNDINNGAYQDFAVLPGYTYELKYKLAFGGSGTMNLKVNEGAATIASDSKTTNGSYMLNFTPTASTVRVHYAGNVKFMLNYIQLEYLHTDTIVTVSSPVAGYRYGFQAEEKDDEIKGSGNSVNYEYRMHDPRLGRFFVRDPLAFEYPHNSPYAFSENSTIAFIELEGLEKVSYRAKRNGMYGGETWHDYTGKSDARITQALGWVEEYHQGHISTERVKRWKPSWYVTVVDQIDYWGRSEGTEISFYNNREDWVNDKPFKVVTQRDFSQWFFSNGDGTELDGHDDPANLGGVRTPDAVHIGVGYSAIAGVGTKSDINFNFILKGPDASIKPVVTYTLSAGGGVSFGGGLNFGYTNKIGGPLLRTDFETRSDKGQLPTVWGSAGLSFLGKVGVSGSYTPQSSGGIYSNELNIGLGAPTFGSGSGGVSNTYNLSD